MAAPSFALRVVDDNGDLGQFLPDFTTLEMSPVFCTAGTVTFGYPDNGKNSDLLEDDLEIAVTMDGVEIGELRCIIEATAGDDASEAEDGVVRTYTCRTILALFDRAVIYPKNWPVTTPPTHDFANSTAGRILSDLLFKCQGRGTLTGVSIDFNGLVDSNGDSWSTTSDFSFAAGITYTEVLQAMVDAQVAEVRMNGRTLQAFNPNGLGVDRSTGPNPLRFQWGRDVRESPRNSTTRELGTVVLASGDNNTYVERSSDSATMSRWGRREWYFSASSVTGTSFLDYVASKVIDTRNRPTLEVTHGLHFGTAVNPRPITNFGVGDWSLSSVGHGWERYRIKQWVMSVSNTGEVTGSVTLNDLLKEQLEKLNKKVQQISGGLSGTGASEEKDDGKAPAKPTGVHLTTDYYMDRNTARAVVTVNWSPVSTNADGTPMSDLDLYRVRWRYGSDSVWRQTLSADSDQTSMLVGNLLTNQLVEVQVAAVDSWGHSSGYTSTVSITTAKDSGSPEKPEAPVVTSNVGTLRVSWSGLDYQGSEMAADYAGVEVHIGTSPSFTPSNSTRKDYLTARSQTATTLTGLTYGTEYWARLVAVDTSGNKSAPSDSTTTSHAVLRPVVNIEIGTGQIGLGNIRFSDVGNLVDDGSFENADSRGAREQLMVGTHMSFDGTTSSNGTWSLKLSPVDTGVTEEVILQQGLPAKPGERFFGAADYKLSSDSSAAAAIQVALRFFDKDGAALDPTTGGPAGSSSHATLASNFTGPVSHDNAWHPRVTTASKQAPPNTASVNVILRVFTLYSGNAWVDALEIRRQVDTLMVADAAIGSAQIANLAVNDAHIANLSVGKLTTGTLGADIIVGSRIKTADTGARAEMNSGGFGLWNSSGVQTFMAAASNGAVRIRGQLVSEFSGRRIEINPTTTNLPELRFYPSSGSNYGFLNALDGSSGNEVWIGLNSGSFAGNNSALSQYRLFLTNGDTGAHLQTVRSADQSVNGGYLRIDSLMSRLGVEVSGRRYGFLETYHDAWGDAGARVGYDGPTTSKDCWTSYWTDGSISMTGRWDDRYQPGANDAVVVGNIDFSSSIGGVTYTWGPTALTRWYPVLQVRDQTAHAAGMTSCNTTGFECSYDVATTGVSSLHYFAYRGYS